MALKDTDLKEFKSVYESDTNNCGGLISDIEIQTSTDNNLFPDTSAGGIHYRKCFKKNTSTVDTWNNVVSWIVSQPKDCVVYVACGLNHADDTKGRLSELTPFTTSAKVALVSNGSDTRSVDIVGEDALGNRILETVILNGLNEVLSVNTYSRVYYVAVQTLNDIRTLTIKEGSGGAVRGTIGINGKLCTCFRSDITSKGNGYKHGNIAPGGVFGLWYKLTVSGGAGYTPANTFIMKSEGDIGG